MDKYFQVIQIHIVFVVIFNSSLKIVTVQQNRFRVVLEFYRQASTLVEYYALAMTT